MKIIIDADGCPVVDIAVEVSKKYNIECIIVCDTAHEFRKESAKTITVAKGSDSVDFAVVNIASKGDLVITQDYGLAAMCLARNAFVLNQNGMKYTAENIDSLLGIRHMSAKIRKEGGRLKGNTKRLNSQNIQFKNMLLQIIEKSKESI